MTRIIALANQKGGVGKTTTTLNLGAALADRGRRVLLIDLDPQSNLTTALGLNPYDLDLTMYDVLHNAQRSAAMAIQQVRSHVHLLPATLDMAAAEIELSSAVGRELLLRKALAPIRADYDYILIDPPPSLGLFTLNALVAATEVVIPLQVEIFALQGIVRLQKTIELVRDLNPVLGISGVLCTMVDQRTSLSTGIEAKARAFFGEIVYTTVIPQNVRLAESPGLGQSIFEYDPSSNGARAYAALAEEVDRGKKRIMSKTPLVVHWFKVTVKCCSAALDLPECFHTMTSVLLQPNHQVTVFSHLMNKTNLLAVKASLNAVYAHSSTLEQHW